MLRGMARWTAIVAIAVGAAAGSSVAAAQACSGFTDVAASSPFCPSVEWMKNRGITTGCGGAAYCPDQAVSRLAMAAFMKRLGTALTPIQLRVDAAPGAVDLDGNVVVCQTADQGIDGFPRRAYADAVFSATAASDVGFAADLVVSADGGANWSGLNSVGNKGSIGANQWAGLSDIGFGDLGVGQSLRWGVRVTRGGLPGTADLADSRCQLRVLLFSRDGATSPY